MKVTSILSPTKVIYKINLKKNRRYQAFTAISSINGDIDTGSILAENLEIA